MSTVTSPSPLSGIVLGWPLLFLVKKEAAPPSAASLRALPPSWSFIAVSANGHTHGVYIGFLHSGPAFSEGGVKPPSLHRCHPPSDITALIIPEVREWAMGGCHACSPEECYFHRCFLRWWNIQRLERPLSRRQEGTVTRAALSRSLACQYAHQRFKYRCKRGDGGSVCRFMQMLFIHPMSTWLSAPALVQPSGVSYVLHACS